MKQILPASADIVTVGAQASSPPPAGLSRGALAMIAVACGTCVANNYYCQPLLLDITRSFHMSPALAGLVPTMTQAGIALGMVLLLPLGDVIDNRRLVSLLLAVQVVALATMTATGNVALFFIACILVGICGIVTYLLPAFATKLVEPARRGAITGSLAQGILSGIMLSRSFAGFVGLHFGWRSVYAVATITMALTTLFLRRMMPPTPGLVRTRYLTLLRSLIDLIAREPVLRRATLIQALSFGSFNALWIGLSLYLQSPAFGLKADAVGSLALLGAVSALAAPLLGRQADRRGPRFALRLSLGLIGLGWLAMFVLAKSYVGVISGVVLIGLGTTGTDVTSRTVLYGMDPAIRMRLNAVYSAGTFIGGGLFSFLTAWLWARHGWTSICLMGLLGVGLALLISWSGSRSGSGGGTQAAGL